VPMNRGMHPPVKGVRSPHGHPDGDTSFAGVRRELNLHTLRVTARAGPLIALVHVAAFASTRRPTFLLLAAITAGLGALSRRELRIGRANAEFILSTGAIGVLLLWPVTDGAVRGGLTAGLVVLAMIGYLTLPMRARIRTAIIIGVILVGQLAWALVGVGEVRSTAVHVAVSLVYLAIGLFAMGIARRALEQSESARLEIFRRVPLGLIRVSRTGRLIEVNPAFADMLGYDARHLVGRPLADLYEDAASLLQLGNELDTADMPQRYAHRVLKSDGTAIWVRGQVQAIRDADGSILYYEGAVEDVTQRREMEERSRIHAERFRNVFERAPIAIWEEDWTGVGDGLEELRAAGVVDLAAHLHANPDQVLRLHERVRYIDVNPAGVTLTGASTKEEAFANTKPDPPPSPIATSFIKEYTAVWEGQDHMTLEAHGSRIDGEPLNLQISWAAMRDGHGQLDLSHVIVAMIDITDEKRAQHQLAALAASKDELVASVSHELRTPITTIMGMALELHDNPASFSADERDELIGIIADQSREVSNIVDDLLVAARSDLGTIVVRPSELQIRPELEQVLASSAPAATPVIAASDEVVAWADSLRFRQIIRNLVTNAGRYGGPTVCIAATIENDEVVLTVSDDGKGVPPGDEEAIFLPYVRSTRDGAYPGSIGLGLPISRHLARLMGGDLTYRYENGSVFELRLPTPGRVTATT
jgi:PAS domain S-box-containing protein